MDVGSTIVALASAPGHSLRAIIRVSGPAAFETIDAIASGPVARERGIGPIRLGLGAGELPALAITMTGPRSYTGEDSVELLVPGAPALVDLVLGALLEQPGVRSAEPGEFSARAYLNGRLSLDEAEGVAQRIGAATAAQLDAADRLLSGEAGREEAAWSDRLAQTLALVEAGVDFTDQEDVHPIGAPELRAALGQIAGEITARLGRIGASEASEGLAVVALVGRPNAGKSTLLNAMVGRQRAVVSPEAGATRDAIAETVDLSGAAPLAGEVTLVDLPGLDAGGRAGAAGAAQQAALQALAQADVLVHCDPEGRCAPDQIPGDVAGRPVICVRTMADLLDGAGPGAGPGVIGVCALDGCGLDELRRAIAEAISGAGSRAGEALLLAPRRRRALARAAESLGEAIAHAQEGGAPGSLAQPEVVAAAMRAALDALGELGRQITPDEVLGRVFRSFCIGK
ncbi:MAG: GTPase [Phycisphaerales bacterium JB039]